VLARTKTGLGGGQEHIARVACKTESRHAASAGESRHAASAGAL
jgi:hypothetical protein